MGQCFSSCIPDSLDLEPEVYAGPGGLPNDIIQVSTSSDQDLRDEFIGLIMSSLCGSTKSPPEAALSWAYDPMSSGGNNPTGFLTSEPSANRIKYFKFIAGFGAHSGFRHGGCFALKDSQNGKLVAATVTFPPNKKNLHQAGICEIMKMVGKMGGWAKIKTPEIEGGRMDKLEKAMKKSHEAHAPGFHLYVQSFATAVGHHGKGYGRRLMEFLTESAERMDVPVYLECCGVNNERFYGNNGFKMMKRYPVEYKNESFNPDGLEGFAAMVRPK